MQIRTLKPEILNEIKKKEHALLQAKICSIKDRHIATFNRWVVDVDIKQFSDINVLNAIATHLDKSIDEITEIK